MADKSTQLVLTALTQAVAYSEGLPLHGGKAVPGLFPANAAGKQAAQRCVEDGLISRSPTSVPPAEAANGKKTKTPPECYTLTEKGFMHRGLMPEDILITMGGGDAGGHSCFIPSWSRGRGSIMQHGAIRAPQ